MTVGVASTSGSTCRETRIWRKFLATAAQLHGRAAKWNLHLSADFPSQHYAEGAEHFLNGPAGSADHRRQPSVRALLLSRTSFDQHAHSALSFRARVGAAQKKMLAFVLLSPPLQLSAFFYTKTTTLHDSGDGLRDIGEDEAILDDLAELAGCRLDLLVLSSCLLDTPRK